MKRRSSKVVGRVADLLIGGRSKWTIVAILVYAQKWIIKRLAGLLDLTSRSEFGNRLAGPGDHEPLSQFYPSDKTQQLGISVVDVDGYLAHSASLSKPRGVTNLCISCARQYWYFWHLT